jgi:HEPN domain-containing protein
VSERHAPEGLNRARSNLALARMQGEGVYREDLCFNAQQAVEKAIKALLMQCHVQFPYVHDLAELLTVLEEAGQEIPQAIRQAERLTRFEVYFPCHYTPHATDVDTRSILVAYKKTALNQPHKQSTEEGTRRSGKWKASAAPNPQRYDAQRVRAKCHAMGIRGHRSQGTYQHADARGT